MSRGAGGVGGGAMLRGGGAVQAGVRLTLGVRRFRGACQPTMRGCGARRGAADARGCGVRAGVPRDRGCAQGCGGVHAARLVTGVR